MALPTSILFPLIAILLALATVDVHADVLSAKRVMENIQNPLLQVNTSRGVIFIELLPQEAPNNVANFIALAEGEVEILDTNTETAFRPHYFDGMRFHRVVPGFLIQAGSPLHNVLGAPQQVLTDEINAEALGLANQIALNTDGSFNMLLNIGNKIDFENEVLKPLYNEMDIKNESELRDRQYEVLETLNSLSVKDIYEYQGFRYTTNHPTRAISRGTMALANQGPNTNGPEFFISLNDSPWLTGRNTVIGKVIEGMETVDAIGEHLIDPLNSSQSSTIIYSIRQVD